MVGKSGVHNGMYSDRVWVARITFERNTFRSGGAQVAPYKLLYKKWWRSSRSLFGLRVPFQNASPDVSGNEWRLSRPIEILMKKREI